MRWHSLMGVSCTMTGMGWPFWPPWLLSCMHGGTDEYVSAISSLAQPCSLVLASNCLRVLTLPFVSGRRPVVPSNTGTTLPRKKPFHQSFTSSDFGEAEGTTPFQPEYWLCNNISGDEATFGLDDVCIEKMLQPIILLPGCAGSRLEALSRSTSAHEIAWVNAELFPRFQLGPKFAKYLWGRTDPDTGWFESFVAKYADVRPVEGLSGCKRPMQSWLLDPILEHLKKGIYMEYLAQYLCSVHGYVENEDLFAYTYDWRQSFNHMRLLAGLKKLIDSVRRRCCSKKVDLICHSVGGLVFRAYQQCYPDWHDEIRRVVTIATPFDGLGGYGLAAFVSGYNQRLPLRRCCGLSMQRASGGTLFCSSAPGSVNPYINSKIYVKKLDNASTNPGKTRKSIGPGRTRSHDYPEIGSSSILGSGKGVQEDVSVSTKNTRDMDADNHAESSSDSVSVHENCGTHVLSGGPAPKFHGSGGAVQQLTTFLRCALAPGSAPLTHLGPDVSNGKLVEHIVSSVKCPFQDPAFLRLMLANILQHGFHIELNRNLYGKRVPGVAFCLLEKIKADPALLTRNIEEAFEKLVRACMPLAAVIFLRNRIIRKVVHMPNSGADIVFDYPHVFPSYSNHVFLKTVFCVPSVQALPSPRMWQWVCFSMWSASSDASYRTNVLSSLSAREDVESVPDPEDVVPVSVTAPSSVYDEAQAIVDQNVAFLNHVPVVRAASPFYAFFGCGGFRGTIHWSKRRNMQTLVNLSTLLQEFYDFHEHLPERLQRNKAVVKSKAVFLDYAEQQAPKWMPDFPAKTRVYYLMETRPAAMGELQESASSDPSTDDLNTVMFSAKQSVIRKVESIVRTHDPHAFAVPNSMACVSDAPVFTTSQLVEGLISSAMDRRDAQARVDSNTGTHAEAIGRSLGLDVGPWADLLMRRCLRENSVRDLLDTMTEAGSLDRILFGPDLSLWPTVAEARMRPVVYPPYSRDDGNQFRLLNIAGYGYPTPVHAVYPKPVQSFSELVCQDPTFIYVDGDSTVCLYSAINDQTPDEFVHDRIMIHEGKHFRLMQNRSVFRHIADFLELRMIDDPELV